MSGIIGARDGNIAIREEFDHAMTVNTVDAWELFIARHPDHMLTRAAQKRLAALTADKQQTPDN